MQTSSLKNNLWRWSGAIITLLAFSAYCWLSVIRHVDFKTAGYDVGIFDQAIRHYAHFMPPYSPLKGIDFNLLGDHFHPILILITPLYWIWNDPRVLLIVQSVLMAASIWLVWVFARRKLPGILAALVTAIYAFGWPLQAMADFEFHEIAFALPLLAWAALSLDEEHPRDRQLFASCLLLLLVREDMGACVLMLGFIRALRKPRKQGIALASIGFVAFFLVTMVIVPAFGDGFGYWQYSVLEEGPVAILKALFLPFDKTRTLLALLIPLGFLPLFSKFSLVAMPIVLQRFLADRESLWTTEYHYNAPVWTIITMATIPVLAKLITKDRIRKVSTWLAAAILLAQAVLSTGINNDMFPLGTMFDRSPQLREQVANKKKIISQIPDNVCVTASERFVPHLTDRTRVTVPGVEAPKPDFIVLHADELPHPVDESITAQDEYDKALATGYTQIAREGGSILLRSGDYQGPRTECGPLAG